MAAVGPPSPHHRRVGITLDGSACFRARHDARALTLPALRQLCLVEASLPVRLSPAMSVFDSQFCHVFHEISTNTTEWPYDVVVLPAVGRPCPWQSSSASPVPHRGPPSTPSSLLPDSSLLYKVAVKPRECFDASALSNHLPQSTMDSCLGTTGFQDFALHCPTDTVFVWVRTPSDVDHVCSLRFVPLSPHSAVLTQLTQLHLNSVSNLCRYVAFGC